MLCTDENKTSNKRSNSDKTLIEKKMECVLSGGQLNFEDAESLLSTKDMNTLANCANIITRKFNGDLVDVETLINAKSGRCPRRLFILCSIDFL